jgi:hypothetical protein
MLLLGSVSNLAMSPSLYASLTFDPTKNFSPVALCRGSDEYHGASRLSGSQRKGSDRTRQTEAGND